MSPAEKLRRLLRQPEILSFPCCYDALSARLIERAGFSLTFMSVKRALAALKEGRAPEETISFEELKEDVGFPEYYPEEERYARDSD
jgi:2-methylisocitrate lyase-like PEP mutase family enzyme